MGAVVAGMLHEDDLRAFTAGAVDQGADAAHDEITVVRLGRSVEHGVLHIDDDERRAGILRFGDHDRSPGLERRYSRTGRIGSPRPCWAGVKSRWALGPHAAVQRPAPGGRFTVCGYGNGLAHGISMPRHGAFVN